MTILEEAEQLVQDDRSGFYGHPRENHTAIAKMWSVVLQCEVTPRQVALCMIALKLAREATGKPKRDTLVDIAGYARCAERLDEPNANP